MKTFYKDDYILYHDIPGRIFKNHNDGYPLIILFENFSAFKAGRGFCVNEKDLQLLSEEEMVVYRLGE